MDEITYGNKHDSMLFDHYKYEDFCPKFKEMTAGVNNQFHPKKVLDVGCAKGYMVLAFNECGVDAWGVDISEFAMADAPNSIRSKLLQVNLDSDKLPFEDEYFDLITFRGTIQYLNNHKHAIDEIFRVLRGGGSYMYHKSE